MVAVRSHTANFTVDVGTVCDTFNTSMLYFNLSSRLKMPGLWSSSRCIFQFNGSDWISENCGFMGEKHSLARVGVLCYVMVLSLWGKKNKYFRTYIKSWIRGLQIQTWKLLYLSHLEDRNRPLFIVYNAAVIRFTKKKKEIMKNF